jgi:hypothetical protein
MDAGIVSPLGRGWRIAAILSLIVVATAVAVNLSNPYPMDFISYWAAGKLALAGDAATAYDIAAHHAVQAGAVAEPTMMPFPYPPQFMLVLLPFGALPFAWAAAVWIGVTLLAYALAVRRLTPGIGALAIAFPPVIVCGIIGQNAFLTAALFIAALVLLPKRPWIAGLVFACLAIKPQLGLLIPLAFIAGREWRAFAGAGIGVIGLALAGLAAFGLAAWTGFFALMPLYGSIAAKGLVGWHKMASVYASLRLAGAPDTFALALHGGAVLAGAALVWRVWRGSADPLARGAALAIGTVVISPYLYVYDQLLLIVALAFLLRSGVSQGVIAALCLLPLLTLVQTAMPDSRINLSPLLPLVLLVLVWRQTSGKGARSGAIQPQRAETENSRLAV